MVTYAKGALSERQIDDGWPYQVTVELPLGGANTGRFERYNGMLAWLRERGVRAQKKSVRLQGRIFDDTRLAFCFAAIEEAHAFQIAFGGDLVAVERPLKKLKPWQWPTTIPRG